MSEIDARLKKLTSLIRKADKLESSENGYSRDKRKGFLRLAGGGWRDPEVHSKLVGLYTEAIGYDDPPYLSIHRRATTYMYAGFLDEALADLKLLEELKSGYAFGIFPLQLHYLRGEMEKAKECLSQINAENKRKGLPAQRISDLKL